ncbi:MAG: DUF2303 family protein [Rhodospirillales bacterium]
MTDEWKTGPIPPAPPRGDAEAIITTMRELVGGDIINLNNGHGVAVVPSGLRLESLKRYADEYAAAPDRRRGTANIDDLDSFVALVNRFKDGDSVIFADRDAAKPSLTAVLNYDHAGGNGAPRFGDHRIVYAFPLAEAWCAWGERDGKKLGQGDFAEWLENRIGDIMPPPTSADLADGRFPGLAAFAGEATGAWADVRRLVELARGLTVNVASRLKESRNLQTGEASLVFEAEHQDAQGAPLKVPSLFLLGLPVFDQGPAYRIAARLRYRVAGQALAWFYQLWRPELAFRHAIHEACRRAGDETALPLFYGRPPK